MAGSCRWCSGSASAHQSLSAPAGEGRRELRGATGGLAGGALAHRAGPALATANAGFFAALTPRSAYAGKVSSLFAMRILLLNQFYYPDIAATAQLCTDWAEDLTRLGHDVTVLCGSGRYRQPHLGRMAEPTRTLPLDEVHHGVRIVRVPVEDAPPPVSALPTRIEQLGRLVGRLSGYGQFVVRALLRLRRRARALRTTTRR